MNMKSRKLIMLVVFTVTVGVFTYLDKVTGADFIEFIKWVFGIYVAGNVATKFSPSTKESTGD